jgi:hypothetical protein
MVLRPRSSSSDESGGVEISDEPRERLLSDAGPELPFETWPFAAVLSAVAEEGDVGDRRCLLKYDVDDMDRGRAGRWAALCESGLVSM